MTNDYGRLNSRIFRQEQRSADNLLYSSPQDSLSKAYKHNSLEIYSEPVIHDATTKPRAQPQVPVYRNMGRRASEGSTLSDKEIYTDISSVKKERSEMVVGNSKNAPKSPYLADSVGQVSHNNLEMPGLNYPSTAGCRLSLDAGRRQSTASLSSSLADGSKDSLSSFDSSSTLTGQDTDDSVIMTRLRTSVQKKEEFLRPTNPAESALVHKEFYSHPKKLDKPVWPPMEPFRQESPSRGTKPTHQNFQRVKNDIDNERDFTISQQNDLNKHITKASKEWAHVPNLGKIQEAAPAPSVLENVGPLNGANDCYSASIQMVHKRAKQFESGKPMPEDDPSMSDRTSFYKSELARLSEKKVVPNVPDRALQFEIMSTELRRDNSAGSTNSTSVLRRSHRDSRSLESSGEALLEILNLRVAIYHKFRK